jgi:prolyl-tRNA synthetase
MRQSKLYTKTRKTLPKDEIAKNAKLLLKAGFIHKEMAGVYSYLPLGLRVLKKIENVIRKEMNAIGGQEILMSSLQDPQIWKKTNRWSDKEIDVWLKTRDEKYGLANTHEDPITNQMKQYISSYKDLPVYAYQFQNKFRNELRAKSGLLRAREFIMKDLYSFDQTAEEQKIFYDEVQKAYMRIFTKVGIGEMTYPTFASGGPFSQYSHEFQTVCESGEDTIYLDAKKKIAINKEVYSATVLKNLSLKSNDLKEVRAIEVGNIFKLGTKYSAPLNLTYKDINGKEKHVVMGSYGIGLGRLMAAVVEVNADDSGLVWPETVAPFAVHLVELKKGVAVSLYNKLQAKNIDVLYDDREISAGEKLKDADLIGIPVRLVMSEKTGSKVEFKKRASKSAQLLTQDEVIRKSL